MGGQGGLQPPCRGSLAPLSGNITNLSGKNFLRVLMQVRWERYCFAVLNYCCDAKMRVFLDMTKNGHFKKITGVNFIFCAFELIIEHALGILTLLYLSFKTKLCAICLM